MPQAAPTPDRPPLHLKGGYLAIASPESISEACFSVPAVRAVRNALPQGTIVVVANQDTAPVWRKVTEINLVIEHGSADSARKSPVYSMIATSPSTPPLPGKTVPPPRPSPK